MRRTRTDIDYVCGTRRSATLTELIGRWLIRNKSCKRSCSCGEPSREASGKRAVCAHLGSEISTQRSPVPLDFTNVYPLLHPEGPGEDQCRLSTSGQQRTSCVPGTPDMDRARPALEPSGTRLHRRPGRQSDTARGQEVLPDCCYREWSPPSSH